MEVFFKGCLKNIDFFGPTNLCANLAQKNCVKKFFVPRKSVLEIFLAQKHLGRKLFWTKKIMLKKKLAQKIWVRIFFGQILFWFLTLGWSKNLLGIKNIHVDTFPGAAAAYLDEQRQLIWMSSGSLSG